LFRCANLEIRERDAIAAKFEASATPTPARGNRGDRGQRGGRGRGRGRGGFSDAPATASGPFALGSVNTGILYISVSYCPGLLVTDILQPYPGRLKEVAVERGTNFTKHRQSMGADLDGVKRKAKMKTEDGQEINYSSSDDSDDARMDVEFIGYLDDLAGKKDDEGDQQMDDEGRPWGAGAPLRVPRSHHHELKSSVNTDSSTKTDKGIKKGKSKVEFETTIKIKDEPVDDDDIALPDLDSPPLSTPSPKAAKPDPEVLTQQFKEETEMEELDRQATLREMVGDFSGIKVDDDVEMVSLAFPFVPS
jgi:DNA-directed RNA polymerase III subunit RPC4